MSRSERLGLLAIVIVMMIVGTWACLGAEERIAYLLYDDAYYYLGVARHLAGGDGSTFDGINATNGYHPLWCWVLIPLFWIVDDPGSAVRIVGMLWYALGAGSAVALWWALRSRSGRGGALIAATLFALHPTVMLKLSRPNGLETPLYALLLALFLGAWERTVAGERASPRRLLALGLLLGAVVLCRLDAGMFSLAAAVLLFVGGVPRLGPLRAGLRVALLAIGASVLVLPVLGWNAARFGSPMPISERAMQVYAESGRMERGGVTSPSYWRGRAQLALEAIPIGVAREAVAGWPAMRPLWRSGKAAGIALVVGFVIAVAAAIRLRSRGRDAWSDAIMLLAMGCTFHYAAYAGWFWVGGERGFRLYYFMPEGLLAAATLGTLAGRAARALAPQRTFRWTAASAGLAAYAAFSLTVCGDRLAQVRSEPGPLAERRLFGWVRQNLPANAVLATTDAGLLGFFCGRPVVNLDGLINDDRFLEALRRGERDRYVSDSPITHLVAGVGALRGWSPERPDIPPDRYDWMGTLLYEVNRIPGRRLKEVTRVENWLVFEILRDGAQPPH